MEQMLLREQAEDMLHVAQGLIAFGFAKPSVFARLHLFCLLPTCILSGVLLWLIKTNCSKLWAMNLGGAPHVLRRMT